MASGDEGKGITTDFLSTKFPDSLVIRFSGGQQAGHNVVIGEKWHTYSTFGSGTGRGLPTFISEFCTFYPPNMVNEWEILKSKGYEPMLYIHPLAVLTTPHDVAWGRLREKRYNHGSCGIGVGATMMRQDSTPYKLHMVDLTHPALLGEKLKTIGKYYMDKLIELKMEQEAFTYFTQHMVIESERFYASLESPLIKELITCGMVSYDKLGAQNYIFEGSQGIMLDMQYGLFPHVTYAHTTSKNALSICRKLGIKNSHIDVYYVTRCYQTRHGQGWMSPDVSKSLLEINNTNEHNRYNEWQRDFRVSELDYSLLKYAIEVDGAHSNDCGKHLIVTCLDQRKNFQFKYDELREFQSIYESWSPDSRDFREIK